MSAISATLAKHMNIEVVESVVKRYFPQLQVDHSFSEIVENKNGTYIEYSSTKTEGVFLYFEKTSADDEPVIGGVLIESDRIKDKDVLIWESAQTIDELLSAIRKRWDTISKAFG